MSADLEPQNTAPAAAPGADTPELQRRGLFRTEYEGTTLRENLGLERPVNQFTVRKQKAA